LALALTACTAQPVPTPSATPADDGWQERGPITLAVASGSAEALRQPLENWNGQHPNEPVALVELASGGGQRAPLMAERAEAKSGEYTIVQLGAAETVEFAAKGWLTELPADQFPTVDLAPAAVSSASYDSALYAYPESMDAGLLYYRTDLLKQAGVKPPTTWAGLRAACARVLLREPSMSCYAGQFGREPDLTSNVAEAIWSAGGDFVSAEGTADVDTPAATSGLQSLAEASASGVIPRAALSWSARRARQAFADGGLLFLRDWWSAGVPLGIGDSAAKVGVGLLPGPGIPGVAALGGVNLGISTHARNKATAADVVRYLVSPAVQRPAAVNGWLAPTSLQVVSDAGLNTQVPSLVTLAKAIKTARPLPTTTSFRAFSVAVQETSLPVLRGERTASDALADLQGRLDPIFG
jgi:multiple sugar transport system substrate-binding protein